MIYNELMSDFEMDEKDFAADSWSLAVDSSFLQQHKKEVMKQQDVIYGEPRRPPRDSSARSCLQRPAPLKRFPWSPGPCLASHRLPLELLVSQAPSLSLPSSQLVVFTLCLFGAQRLARDCGKLGCVEDTWLPLAGVGRPGNLKATAGLESDARFTRWRVNPR